MSDTLHGQENPAFINPTSDTSTPTTIDKPGKMTSGSFSRQLIALLKRNFLLKRRMKSTTIQEIFFPLYLVGILGIVRFATKPKELPAIAQFPEYPLQTINFLPQTILLVSPDTPSIRSFADDLTLALSSHVQQYKAFNSWEDAEQFYDKNKSSFPSNVSLVGLDFPGGNLTSGIYRLRFSSSTVPGTTAKEAYNSQGQCREQEGLGFCTGNKYIHSGFIQLQNAIETLLIQHLGGTSTFLSTTGVQQMPKSPWSSDTTFLLTFSAIYLVIAYSTLVSTMLAALVTEKEKKIKDAMKMMGLNLMAHWLSWLLTYVTIVTVITAAITGLARAVQLFIHSNLGLVFLLLLLYGYSIICLAFLLTPFFTKAEVAGGVGSMMTMLFSLLYLAVSLTRTDPDGSDEGPQSRIPAVGQWFMCLLSPIALALGVDQALYLDISEGGLRTSNLWRGQFPVAGSMIMLTVDCVLYSLLAVYFDNVIPDAYGQRRSPIFFLLPSYWCPRQRSNDEMVSLITAMATSNANYNDSETIAEPVTEELAERNVIRICNVKKSFTSCFKAPVTAVNGVSLDIYEGQITAILGHNGAGKSTLISVLTGLTRPTEGKAFIYGMDVTEPSGQDTIHSMLGVCPQENILLPELTCWEHLRLFAAIKNIRNDSEVAHALEDVDLGSQKDTKAGKLSGGQKRKLCLAMALIGNPKVLILDEPTAGLDPSSRRHIWALLKDRCKGRVIILTTHFMDEADILADRKAFISKGQLKCVGSSLFLKNRFGLGYHVNLVVDGDAPAEPITSLVQSHTSEGTLERAHGQELTYLLPLQTIHTFPALLTAVEEAINEGSLGIQGYGVTTTTLEEVFLKIGIEEETDDSPLPTEATNNGTESKPFQPMSMGEGNSTTMTDPEDDMTLMKGDQTLKQFLALCKIRYLHLLRNKLSLFFRIIMPVVFIVVGVVIFPEVDPKIVEPEPLEIVSSLYVKTPQSEGMPGLGFQVSGAAVTQNWRAFVTTLQSSGVTVTNLTSQDEYLTREPHYTGINVHGMNVSTQGVLSTVTAVYNSSATHSLPVILNLISNTLLSMVSSSPDSATPQITAYSFPWPDVENIRLDGASFGAVMLIGLALAPTPAMLAMLLIRDREMKIRSQLRVSGVRHTMYWATVVVTDLSQLLFIFICVIITVTAKQLPVFASPGALLTLSLTFILYLPLLLVLAYVFTFAFKKFQVAQAVLYNIFSLLAILPYMAVSMTDGSGLVDAARIMHLVLCAVDPVYAPIGVLYYLIKVYMKSVITRGLDVQVPVADYFAWDNLILFPLIIGVVHLLWLPLLLRFIEVRSTGGSGKDALKFGSKTKHRPARGVTPEGPPCEDSDVEEEAQRVDQLYDQLYQDTSTEHQEHGAQRPVVVAHKLHKAYPPPQKGASCLRQNSEKAAPRVAVACSSFSVAPGEVLGLLGPNGAGKTTTLNMIVAEDSPTHGSVHLAGYDVRSSVSEVFQHLGYCPQHDPLWEDITLREHLDLYLALKGYVADARKAIVQYYLTSLRLTEHADKVAKKLSGGTKRKLSYAMSTIGHPELVLLDEPSTGLDPKSKRFLWDTISARMSGSSSGAILTTHYMEEADALCSRVAIMVNGSIQCIGSTQHLKNKYGNGYVLEAKLSSAAHMDALHRFVTTLVPGAERTEHFGERAAYRVRQDSVGSVARIFTDIEHNKERLGIEDYSFSQSTLEQVFLEFAKRQREDGETSDEKDDTNLNSSQHQLTTQL